MKYKLRSIASDILKFQLSIKSNQLVATYLNYKIPCCKVIRGSSCLFGKQMRQTSAAVPINLFMYFYGIGTPALPFGCFVALRSLSHCLQLIRHSSRQLLVSFMTLHSFRPSFRSITPRSQLTNLLQDMAHLATHIANHK